MHLPCISQVTLPDETIRLLPVGAGVGNEAPPLTKEEERRSYRAQVPGLT